MAAATDIADVALRWLVRHDWEGIQGVGVRGPQDLSFSQAAAIMERALERPVRYQELSPNHYVQTLLNFGASIGMFSQLAQRIGAAEPRTVESATPTTLAAWAESELLPAVESFCKEPAYPPARFADGRLKAATNGTAMTAAVKNCAPATFATGSN
jgi:hypothetical protein